MFKLLMKEFLRCTSVAVWVPALWVAALIAGLYRLHEVICDDAIRLCRSRMQSRVSLT